MVQHMVRHALGLILLVALSSRVSAQAGEEPAEYRDAIRSGLREYDTGNLAEAKLYFTKAHAAYPNARTLRGLGMVAYGLRDYAAAVAHFEQALVSTEKPLSAGLQSELRELLGRSRAFLASVRIELDPSDAQLRIDGVVRDHEHGRVLWMNPGEHALEVAKEGYDPLTRRIDLAAGAELVVALKLEPLAETIARRPLGPVSDEKGSKVESPWFDPSAAPVERSASVAPWVVLAVSTAVVIAGGVLLGMAASDIATVENADTRTSWSSIESEYDRAPIRSGTGFALVGLGTVGIGIGIGWMLWPSHTPSREAARLNVSLGQAKASRLVGESIR